jgi:hypothetical protein
MEPCTVVIGPCSTSTRVLLTRGPDELLRAYLPAPSQVRHERSMPVFLEGLALLLDSAVRVVLSVDERQAACCLGLTDPFGMAERSLYYQVEVITRPAHRRRGRRIRGIGNFADLRHLQLVSCGCVGEH